jgi:hypothetical protein
MGIADHLSSSKCPPRATAIRLPSIASHVRREHGCRIGMPWRDHTGSPRDHQRLRLRHESHDVMPVKFEHLLQWFERGGGPQAESACFSAKNPTNCLAG